jgi:hypothetical protein
MLHMILILNLFSSFFLCGLIWTIQLVHYPMFHYIDKTGFTSYIAFHGFRISWIVIPVMITELVTSFALVLISAPFFYYHISGLITVILIWTTTLFVQLPLHQRLSKNRSEYLIRKLIRTNWIRTALWTFKSLLAIAILYKIVT